MERGFGAEIVSGPLLLCLWTLHTNNNIMEEKEAEFQEVKQKKQEGYTVYKDEKEVEDLNSIDIQRIRTINIDDDNKCIYVY